VSAADQNMNAQIDELKRAGCDVIRSEKASGRSLKARDEFELLLTFLRPGDELWVTRIDRFARSLKDLCDTVERLKNLGVALRATQQPIDYSTPAGSAFLSMLGVFAQFEVDIRKDSQMAGIRRAIADGKYKQGRPKKAVDRIAAIELEAKIGASAAARQLGVSRATLYRTLTPALRGAADLGYAGSGCAAGDDRPTDG
jgi:DNA invertase Pin-like site-specific DNA recombinase